MKVSSLVRRTSSASAQGWRIRVFYATWLLYAAYYFCRKDAGKLPELVVGRGDPLTQVAHALVLFGLAYAAAQLVAGWLADRYGGAVVIFSGALISALSTIALSFGVSPATALLLESVNGFGQGFGWCGSLKLLGQSFASGERARVMAWWSGSYILGGYLATFLATWLTLAPSAGARAFAGCDLLVSGMLLLAVALGAFIMLRHLPPSSSSEAPAPPITVVNRPLLVISAMYFFLKMMRYALLFWLPLYFTTNLGYSTRSAQNTASFFTLFGLAGSLLTVWLADRVFMGQRFRASAILLFLLAFVLLLHPVLSHSGAFGAIVSVSLMGMIIHGVDLLMSGIQALDSVPPSHHGRAVGIVNSVGSLGQMLSALVVTGMSHLLGWDWLFNVFVGCALLSAVICCSEWKATPAEPLIPALT